MRRLRLREDDRVVVNDGGYANDTFKRATRRAGVACEVCPETAEIRLKSPIFKA